MNVAAVETVVSWRDHEGPRVSRVRDYDIIACTMCGFRHVVPLPGQAEMMHAYREAYYRDEKPTFIAHAAEDEEWSALAHGDRLDACEKLLGPSRRRLLDIGAGPGFFLKTAKARGWRVFGIEPSRQAAAHAREMSIEVAEGFFDAETAPGLGRFDAINLNNVLEHVPDPITVLGLTRNLLDPGGILCVNVPNDFSPLQTAARAALGLKEWWVAPPHHLNYFDFDSLSDVLTRLGFRIVDRTTSFPMELFLLMGDDYTGNPALGRACHARRKRFDLAFEAAGLREIRRAFYRALASAGIGREAVIIARKQ